MPQTLQQTIGARGETLAREHLEEKGLEFVAANWLCKAGEIDLIMKSPPASPLEASRRSEGKGEEEEVRVIVEVRSRKAGSYGQGLDTVTTSKQQKIRRATQAYQQQENYWGSIRFDVVSIEERSSGEPEVIHIEHAFTG